MAERGANGIEECPEYTKEKEREKRLKGERKGGVVNGQSLEAHLPGQSLLRSRRRWLLLLRFDG